MSDLNDLELSATYLQAALLQMDDRDIPATPANVRIWYEYTEGNYKALNEAIDELIENQSAFNASVNRELYERFFDEFPLEQLKAFKQAVQELTTELSLELSDFGSGAEECEGALVEAEQALASECELEALRNVTAQLIAETRKVVAQNGEMASVISAMKDKMSSLTLNLEKANTEAMTDALTGIANRRAFEQRIDQLLPNLGGTNQACLLMMDIDNFKLFNDRHGHAMGDKVLCFVVQMIKKVIKGNDFLARTGGEEFQLILEDCTLPNASAIAEKIRQTLEATKLTRGPDRASIGNVTVSIGVAKLSPQEGRNQLINRVDQYLYKAKAKGRNQVVCEP